MIQRAERLPDLLAASDARIGDLTVLPIAPRQGRKAELVILQARKGGKGRFRLLAPLVMHQGARHIADGESYTEQVNGILRHGKPLMVE